MLNIRRPLAPPAKLGARLRKMRALSGAHKKLSLALYGCVVLAALPGSVALAHYTHILNSSTPGIHTVQSAPNTESNQHSAGTLPVSEISKTSTSPTSAQTPSPSQASKSTTSSTKYATSPDPRSTTYSTMPPAPGPADFSTTITHSGQVSAGTLIGYDATLNLHTYYGGDLTVSSANLSVLEQYGSTSQSFTISTPDGTSAAMPHAPWNDQSSTAFAATNGPSGIGTSWTMFLQLYGKPTPSVTPYIIHLQTMRTDGDNQWEYDAFIPLYVDY